MTAARMAIARQDVALILPYVKERGESEVRAAFDRTLRARDGNPAANELAELYFFETVVRVHRAGEGAPYTGLKPAGLPVGPIIPIAERTIATGDATELIEALTDKVRHEVAVRFGRVLRSQPHARDSIVAGREYVESMLGLEVWSHKVYSALDAAAHDEEGGDIHRH